MLTSVDFQALLPRRVDLWGKDSRPMPFQKDEPETRQDSGRSGTKAKSRHHKPVLTTSGVLTLQVIEPVGPYGETARIHPYIGCITRLARALEALSGRTWTFREIAVAVEKVQAARNQTMKGSTTGAPGKVAEAKLNPAQEEAAVKRLEHMDQGYRTDSDLVAAVACTFGVDLDDLFCTVQMLPEKLGKTKAEWIAEIAEQREQYTRAFKIRATPLVSAEDYYKLAEDIATTGTEVRLQPPWPTSPGSMPHRRWPPAMQQLEALLSNKTLTLDLIAKRLESVATELNASGLWTKVGRHIRVARSGIQPAIKGVRKRRTIVSVAYSPDVSHLEIDFLRSLRHMPTMRYECLFNPESGASASIQRAAAADICEDMNWCGHWEGRLYDWSPPDVPDWLKQAAEQHGSSGHQAYS